MLPPDSTSPSARLRGRNGSILSATAVSASASATPPAPSATSGQAGCVGRHDAVEEAARDMLVREHQLGIGLSADDDHVDLREAARDHAGRRGGERATRAVRAARENERERNQASDQDLPDPEDHRVHAAVQ